MEPSMPFDGAEFLREPVCPASNRGARYSRFVAKLGRVLRARLRRSVPEPIDAAVLRVLEEARGLIEQREDWTQGTLETIRGQRCAVGALRLAAGFLNYPLAGRIAHDLLTAIAIDRGFASIEALNDRSRHGTVLSVFDAAIAVTNGTDGDAPWKASVRIRDRANRSTGAV
jgi:hypothetical protein